MHILTAHSLAAPQLYVRFQLLFPSFHLFLICGIYHNHLRSAVFPKAMYILYSMPQAKDHSAAAAFLSVIPQQSLLFYR